MPKGKEKIGLFVPFDYFCVQIKTTMFKFISFGSGSSGNCYFLYTGTDGLLIDAGISVRTLKKNCDCYGLSFSKIKNVIVTHDHADHVKYVGKLSRDFALPVYATQKVHEGIKKNHCVKVGVPQENMRFLEKNVRVNIGDFEVTPFYVPHDSADSVGYMVNHDGVSFCLMTDIGHVTDEMKGFIARTDYLVIEANHDVDMLNSGPYPKILKTRVMGDTGHLCNHDCAAALAENISKKLKHVWLCHLSEENNHPTIARKEVEQMLAGKGFVVGEDFGLDVLKRKVPSEVFELV